MKCNVRELAQISDATCVIEGRLNYKKLSHGGYRNQGVFKERWFRLIKNYLFYFKLSDMGTFDTKNPAGVFVMENSSIQMEHGQSLPFSFSISFIDEPEKKHIFAARAEDNVVQWVMKLRDCSYEYLRSHLHVLQSKIYAITGKDPLLLVPRNEGACLWAPAMPFSALPACNNNSSSFNCHLHAHSAFTLTKSKSDLEARSKFEKQASKFYTNTDEKKESCKENFSLERSRTDANFNIVNESIFGLSLNPDNTPSPPVRKKSAALKVYETGEPSLLLDEVPTPAKRKISPRSNPNVLIANGTSDKQPNIEDDLITF